MKPKLHKWKRNVLLCAGSALLLVALGFAAAHETRQLAAGEKATVTGAILSRDGDLIRILDKKSNDFVVVNINDDTKIERRQHRVVFFRHTDMDATAMVPGLTIHAEAADELANEDAAAAAMLNRLVSDLDDYRNEFEVDVFFPKGSADLDEA